MDKHHQSAILKMLCCFILAAGLLSYQFYKDRVLGFNANIYSLAEPFYKVAHYPVAIKNGIVLWFREKEDVIDRKDQLELENIRLRAEVSLVESLKLENNRLKSLLNTSQNSDFEYKLAEVINVSVKPYSHQIVINKGLVDGVYEGQPVIDDLGVLGQVSSVSLNHALVTLITNSSQAVPVIVQRNGLRLIVQGTANGNNMTINFVEAESDVQQGDILVSSGLGKVYPRGYPVAKIMLREDVSDQPFIRLQAQALARMKSGTHVILVWPNQQDILNDSPYQEALPLPTLPLSKHDNRANSHGLSQLRGFNG